MIGQTKCESDKAYDWSNQMWKWHNVWLVKPNVEVNQLMIGQTIPESNTTYDLLNQMWK